MKHGFSIDSTMPLSTDGESSLVFPVTYRRSGNYIGKVARWSLVPQIPLDPFRADFERQFEFAFTLNGEGFSVPAHYGVFDMKVPLVNRVLPVLVEQRVDVVPRSQLSKRDYLRALHDVIDEKMLAEFEGFVPGVDFYSNLLYSEANRRFMVVDFGYWQRRE